MPTARLGILPLVSRVFDSSRISAEGTASLRYPTAAIMGDKLREACVF